MGYWDEPVRPWPEGTGGCCAREKLLEAVKTYMAGKYAGLDREKSSIADVIDALKSGKSISTFADVKEFLDMKPTLSEAKTGLIGIEIADTWIDYDVTGSDGDADPKRTADNHPIWNDPMVITDVRMVDDADGNEHMGAVLMRKYASAKKVVFDAANQEKTNDTVADGVSCYYKVKDTTQPIKVPNIEIKAKSIGGGKYGPLDAGTSLERVSGDIFFKNKYFDRTKNIVVYGNNIYGVSAIRQYLNSDAEKGSWWKSQYVGQVAPSQSTTVCGYMKGCSQELLSYARATVHTYKTNTVTWDGSTDSVCDKFYLPCVNEVFGASNAGEGSYQYEYWRKVIGNQSAEPSDLDTEVCSVRKIKCVSEKVTPSYEMVILRSSGTETSHQVYHVTTSGTIQYISAASGPRTCPACVIY